MMHRTYMLKHQIKLMVVKANQIDVNQETSSRSGLADMVRHISGSDGNIGASAQCAVGGSIC